MNKISLNTLLKICSLFVLSRLSLLLTFYIALHHYAAYSVAGGNFQYCKNKLLNCLGCWDTGWYLNVAENGYIIKPLIWQQSNYGFFPFYPLCIKLVGLLTGNNFIAGIIVSNVFLFIGSLFLFLLCIKIYRDKKTALLAVLLLYFFPSTYLLSGVFSESAFLCFTIMCVYFFEMEDYPLCGLSGFCLTLTRPFGILILLPFFIAYVIKYGVQFQARALYLLLLPLGIFSFFAYCYFTTGDFLFYVHAKQAGWGSDYVQPWTILINGLKTLDHYTRFNSYYTLLWLILMVFMVRFIPFYLFVWVALLIIAPLATGQYNIICMPRYILSCFPLFMMVAAYTAKHKWGWLLIIFLAGINFILSGFFALGYQFAA